MAYEEDKIKESIASALKDLDLQPEVIDDAVFHMTDWLSDLKEWRIQDIYGHPRFVKAHEYINAKYSIFPSYLTSNRSMKQDEDGQYRHISGLIMEVL